MCKYDFYVLLGFMTATLAVVFSLGKCSKKALQTTEMLSCSADPRTIKAVPTAVCIIDVAAIAGVGYCFDRLLKYLGGGVDA